MCVSACADIATYIYFIELSCICVCVCVCVHACVCMHVYVCVYVCMVHVCGDFVEYGLCLQLVCVSCMFIVLYIGWQFSESCCNSLYGVVCTYKVLAGQMGLEL